VAVLTERKYVIVTAFRQFKKKEKLFSKKHFLKKVLFFKKLHFLKKIAIFFLIASQIGQPFWIH